MNMEDWASAVKDLELAVQQRASASTYRLLEESYKQLGMQEKAEAAAKKAKELDGDK